MATQKITPQQGVDILRRKFKLAEITLPQLLSGTMQIAALNKPLFDKLKAMFDQGKLESYLTGEESIDALNDALNDVYDDLIADLKKELNAGRITSQQYLTKLEALRREADANRNIFQSAWSGVTDFFSNRFEEAKNIVKKTASFTGGQIDKATTLTSKVVTDVSGGVKSIGEGAGSLLKAGGFIIPLVLIGGGLLVYKLVTSDTGKAVAGAATRRFT